MNASPNRSASSGTPHWSQGEGLGLAAEAGVSVVFHHTGEIDHGTLQSLVDQAEAWSLDAGDSVVTRKRLLNVLVEALENLRVHAPAEFIATVFARLHAEDGSYRLYVGNALHSATAEVLQHRIEVLNAMDDAELKEHFLRLLSHDARTERGGAGLGLITMARKAHRPLLMSTFQRDHGTRYLVLQARVLRDA